MKQAYRIEYMTAADYSAMMRGSNNYACYKIDVMANDKDEALAIVADMFPTMVINDSYVKTVAEIKAANDAWDAECKARRAKAEEAKAKKANREKADAEALNLTIEEYKRYKKDKAIIKKLPKEIEECNAEINRLLKEIERKKRYLANLQDKVKKIEEV